MKTKYTTRLTVLLLPLAAALPCFAQTAAPAAGAPAAVPGLPPALPAPGGLAPGAGGPPAALPATGLPGSAPTAVAPVPGLPGKGAPRPGAAPGGFPSPGGPGTASNRLPGSIVPTPGGAPELSAEQQLARTTEIEVIKTHLQSVRAEIAALEQATGTASGGDDQQPQRDARLKALKSFGKRLEGNLSKLEAPVQEDKKDKHGRNAGHRPLQATGAPDAREEGMANLLAWQPRTSSGGKEWLGVIYDLPVEVAEVRIHTLGATGSLTRITSCVRDTGHGEGAQGDRILWEGQEPGEKTPVVRTITVAPGVTANAFRLEFDTTRAPKPQQIDAVEIVGRDGSRQWATSAEASSHFAVSVQGR